MRVQIVAGSQIRGSQSARVAEVLRHRLLAMGLCGEDDVRVHDLASHPLPLWDNTQGSEILRDADFITRCDALILISPDWHGMATPALKNWFYFLPPMALDHKPVLLCGVSAGQGGLYPVMDLRAHSFKNFRPCYLPEHLLIRDVNNTLLEPDPSEPQQQSLSMRTDYCLQLLNAYALGFLKVRACLPQRHKAFSFGM